MGQSASFSCSRCSEPACIGAGETARCERHFREEFAHEVRRAVREFSMIKPRERVAVALSGGKDSVVLLHQLAELRQKLPMELLAILVDEGIAGYRPPTIAVARKACKKLGVPLHIVTFKSETGKSLDSILRRRGKGGARRAKGAPSTGACTYCGVFRRLLLNKSARRLGADKLALGHNLDDAAQTLLLNVYRNETDRLARFWPVSREEKEGETPAAPRSGRRAETPDFIPRIRPLIRIPEREVALLAELEGYGIRHQSCPYANEAMRQTVRAQLNEMEDRYPGTKRRIFNAWMEMGKNEKSTAARDASHALQTCKTCREPSSQDECVACRMKREIAGKK
ncbi:tRNA 2-thiocytidine biosynthesis protein TtcA [uncultured archaeon]|nr:tRNA 2-thiocytidine biosynthesis protein TtcA [uncultured archaeon]